MGKEQDRIDEGLLAKGPLLVTDAAYQMLPGDHLIWANAASNVVVLTLPSMGEAAGMFYCIVAMDVSNDVSVNIKETATEFATYGDLDTQYDTVCFYCTGYEWLVAFSSIT